MTTTDFGTEHEALRYFRALTAPEREEHLWMGLRELAAITSKVSEKQDITNGTVKDTKKELTVHLKMHEMEVAELDFVKRWGGRGTELLGILIALSAAAVVVADKLWR